MDAQASTASGAAAPWRIPALGAWLPADPRVFQIAILGVLLAAGVWFRDFSLRPAQIALTFAGAIAAQRIAWVLSPPQSRSIRSAVITALSLTLLLRADNLIAHPAAAAFAIGSKSIFRIRGKHLFNPAAFGIVTALLAIPGTWVSPGQWGQNLALAGWLVVLGTAVTTRARIGDISWAFLAFYLGGAELRVAVLGYQWPVLTHELTSGALLLFAFFMISDPRTAPDSARGRVAHAALVAVTALAWQFGLYANNGLIWAIVLCAPAIPLWDARWPAPRFQWQSQGGRHDFSSLNSVPDRSRGARDPRRRGARDAA
jgi:Na+-transporting NADH:ubiquinone oxidoreductase subunit NqrB